MSINSIVTLAAGKIGDILAQEANLLYGVKNEVRSLEKELGMMHAFLTDTEGMDEEGGDERSRIAITEIRKIAYDAEDIVESYILEANLLPPGMMGSFFKRYFYPCTSLSHTHQVVSDIQAINARIDETLKSWSKYVAPNGGIRTDAGTSGQYRDSQRPNQGRKTRSVTYPHPEEEHVVGLEEDIKKLVGLLTTNGAEIQMLSIVGMGGSGKTTLARKLYNHDSVKRHFDCLAWLSISKEWVAEEILLELLRKIIEKEDATCRNEELVEKICHNSEERERYLIILDDVRTQYATCRNEVLVEKIRRYLEERERYLIILDDVWTQEALRTIYPTLPKGERRIIITTRIQHVAAGFEDIKSSIHKPRPLTKEESWALFKKKALIHQEEYNVLEILGKEMLKKCEGLPLAVIVLAGILSKKKTLEHWEKVQKAVSSWIMRTKDDALLYGSVNKMLTLSYNDLHYPLKPCFLYLAMFQEDAEIQAGLLIKMWIAEGFITPHMCKEGETLEDVARGCLEELIDRCVVQIESKSFKGNVKSIRVHDLVRDLCIEKARQQVFLEMSTQSSNSNSRMSEYLRRTAIYCNAKCNYLPLPTLSRSLRSLIYEVVGYDLGDQQLSLENMHQNFKLLRVLNLKGVRTSNGTLPTGIGSLIHLRCLILRYTNIYKLPPSIGNLRNLLTLECTQGLLFSHESIRIDIPDVLWKIKGLRHLSFYFRHSIEGIMTLHTLKELQTIKGIGGGSWMLKELPNLSPTVQKLKINGISSEEQLEAVLKCPSIILDTLHSLGLELNDDPTNGEVVVLKNLQPISQSQHLKKLHLNGKMQDRLSSCNQFPTSIIKLELFGTGLVEEAELAVLDKRLPKLMSLALGVNAYLGTKWTLRENQFQQLKELYLYALHVWEEWSIERGSIPQLSELRIWGCWRLRRLPEGLKFITTLQKLNLVNVGDELKKRTQARGENGGGEDAHIIRHVPRVIFSDL